MPGTILLAPLPRFPNEMTPLEANIKLTTASQDLRGGTVEPGGPMEPSTHCTCGSYEAKATPRLLSPPWDSCVSVLSASFLYFILVLFVEVLTNVNCKPARVCSYSCNADTQYSNSSLIYLECGSNSG